jgi:hypothetical protein
MNRRRYVLAVLSFTAAYAVAYEASNWGTIYLLDWWDPKFGDRRGNIAFGHEIMPFFLIVALISFLAGAASRWKRIGTAQSGLVAWSSAVVALVSQSALLLGGWLTKGSHGTVWVTISAWTLLLAGPAVLTMIVFTVASRRRSTT